MLSIIILTRNEEKNIGNMLRSIVSQKYMDKYEIIIVDANSTDQTRQVITGYFDVLPLIIVDGEGKGIGVDRNIGGEMCMGDIIFFTEGDCILTKGVLDEIYQLFLNKNLVAWSTITIPTTPGLVQLIYKIYDTARYLLTKVPYPLKGYSISGAVLVIRRDAWHKLGGFQEGTNMNDDGFMGRKIRDEYRNKNQFVFCLRPKYPIYRRVDRFIIEGYIQTMNHYIYVLVNFVPFLVKYLKNQMVYEGTRFIHEK